MKKSTKNKIPIKHYSEPHYFENTKEIFHLMALHKEALQTRLPPALTEAPPAIGKTGILGGPA